MLRACCKTSTCLEIPDPLIITFIVLKDEAHKQKFDSFIFTFARENDSFTSGWCQLYRCVEVVMLGEFCHLQRSPPPPPLFFPLPAALTTYRLFVILRLSEYKVCGLHLHTLQKRGKTQINKLNTCFQRFCAIVCVILREFLRFKIIFK